MRAAVLAMRLATAVSRATTGTLFQEADGTFRIELNDVLANDERAVALTTNCCERLGRTLVYDDAAVFRIAGGKIAEAGSMWTTRSPTPPSSAECTPRRRVELIASRRLAILLKEERSRAGRGLLKPLVAAPGGSGLRPDRPCWDSASGGLG